MEIRCCSFSKMAERIAESGQKIILFGAGAIGTVITPEILSDNGLVQRIACYIDNDSRKWGTEIQAAGANIKVLSPEYLKENGAGSAILLNISRYAEALSQLENLAGESDLTCYVIPLMCIHNFKKSPEHGSIKDSASPLIPKRIHYMWLGGKPLPVSLQNCVDSWKKYCPDYEIIRWDESNYDVRKHPYMKQAYQRGAYGFVPDYARLDILYRYGGIYMDTDVELIRPLDELLYQEAFCGVEKWQVLNFGGCSGAVPGHDAVRKILDDREDIRFIDETGTENRNTCGFYDTRAILKYGYKINGRNQNIAGMNIYTYDYFHPYDYMSGQTEITANTFSIHHFNGGWLDETMKQMNRRAKEAFCGVCERMLFEDDENADRNV